VRGRFNRIKDALAGITPKNNNFVMFRFIRFRLYIVSLGPVHRGVCVLLFVILRDVVSYAKCQTCSSHIRYRRYNTLQRRMRKP